MRLRLIRSATLRLSYAGRELLLDPFLAPKHSRPAYAGRSPNPLVDLPCPPEEVLAGAEATIISHLHSDHFDPEAQHLLRKDIPIFCQPGDEATIRQHGFQDVTPVETTAHWQGITLTRTPGQHGFGAVLEMMGPVSGFVFQAAGEPVIYWAGDTVWYDRVREVIEQFRPDIIITNSSGAIWGESEPIIMDAAHTVAVCRAAPDSTVIAVHLDSLDHGQVTRASLRAYATAEGIAERQLLIPADGEYIPERD